MPLYPLTFRPILKPRIWGGNRLQPLLRKEVIVGQVIGESWELCDLETEPSVVAQGPSMGKTLPSMIQEWGRDLLGAAALLDGRFPLLLKFLDAGETLSVQVHPDEAAAARLGSEGRVKHEAWYVIDAEPGACIYRGLQAGVTREDLRRAIESGTLEPLLNRLPARKGHVFYLPSGTIHALGAGILAAEVQTPSDVTFRVFDWNRVDPTSGLPRDLHIDAALECVRFDSQRFEEERISHVGSVWTAVTTLIRCPHFAVDRVRMVAGVEQTIPLDGFVVWMILEGRCSISCSGFAAPFEFQRGDTVLFPAGLKETRLSTLEACMWLEVSIPGRSTPAELERPMRETFGETVRADAGFVPLNLPQGGS